MPATLEASASAAGKGLSSRLWELRSSSRLALLLQMVFRVLTALISLAWTPMLLHSMGQTLNGLFLSFTSLAQLGGLGDLGMGGAVAIRAGQYLGQGKDNDLKNFLAGARPIFLFLALTVGGAAFLLCPWLGPWLGFREVPGSGPMPPLFAVGAISVGMVMLYSYVSNLNYACRTLTWPIIPTFAVFQGCMLAHWLLARRGSPLWAQFLPYAVAYFAYLLLAWTYLRVAFPSLATVFPLRFDFRFATALLEQSFWLYLSSLGNLVYVATDNLVIQAWFGPAQIPIYRYNYKVCELAVFVICAASFVSLPKITQWLADPAPDAPQRVRAAAVRLNQFQTVAGCVAALGYLAVNNVFMPIWLGRSMPMLAPLSWQLAFALNLAVTTSGDASIQLATRCGRSGFRVAGTLIGLTALLNVALSILSAKLGHIVGIALATCAAQSALSLGAALYVCRCLDLPKLPWLLKTWLLPVLAVSIAGAARWFLPFHSVSNVLIVAALYLALALAIAAALGVRPALIREELHLLRSFLRRTRA
jgi:O-antigen/teichoic acid export membrane protein